MQMLPGPRSLPLSLSLSLFFLGLSFSFAGNSCNTRCLLPSCPNIAKKYITCNVLLRLSPAKLLLVEAATRTPSLSLSHSLFLFPRKLSLSLGISISVCLVLLNAWRIFHILIDKSFVQLA